MIRAIYSLFYFLGKIMGFIKGRIFPVDIYLFFPLASIGGAELVHLDIIKALYKKYKLKLIIWNRFNPWLAEKTKSSDQYALYDSYKTYCKTFFFEDYLPAKKFSGLVTHFLNGYLWICINKKKTIVIIRNGDIQAKLLFIGKPRKFKLISIMHNSYSEIQEDMDVVAKYLDLDIAVDARVVVSKAIDKTIKTVADKLGLGSGGKTILIHNCVGVPLKCPVKKKNEFIVLFAGRDVMEKRFYLVYSCAKKMLEINKNIRFIFAGPSAEKYAPLDNAKFYGEVGSQEIMTELYTMSSVFLLTSSSEGFPRAIAEAMANGNVIISTNVGGISEHVTTNNGCLIETLNESEIIDIIIDKIQYYFINAEVTKQIQEINFDYAQNNFAFTQFQNDYIKLVEELKSA